MFPTRLNLLSEKKQHHIKRMMTMGFVKNTLGITFVILAAFSIVAIMSQLFLQAYFADITLQSIRTSNPSKKIDERVMHINSVTKRTEAIQAQYTHWTPYLARIFASIPAPVTIDRVVLRKAEGLLELSGTAPSREALLTLKASLELMEEITEVTVPLSDLTKQESIAFTLSIPFTL